MNDAPPPLFPPSAQPPQAQQPYQAPPPPKRGCGKGLGCGLGCLVVVVLCVVGLVFAGIAGKKWVEGKLDEYTSTESVPLEAPQAAPDEVAAAVTKFDEFKNGMDAGGTPVPLTLTGEELNLIIWNHPSFSALAGKANVEINDDQLNSRVSVNFGDLPLPEGGFFDKNLDGKFFNGEVALKLGMAAGRPGLHMENLSVNGVAIPEAFMTGLRAHNLLEEAAKNPEATAFLDRIEDMRIEGGQLIVVPKPAP